MNAHRCVVSALTGAVTATLIATTSLSASAAAAPARTPGAAAASALAAIKTHCDTATKTRLATLSADAARLKADALMTAADRSNLEGQVGADQSGLTALDATIQADTTVSQALSDCQKIVVDYRVYLVLQPKGYEVAAADAATTVNAKLTALEPALRSLIASDTTATAAQKAAAKAALTDLQSKLSAAAHAVSGVSAEVINITPAEYPGSTTTLKTALAAIKAGATDLTGARNDVQTILTELGH